MNFPTISIVLVPATSPPRSPEDVLDALKVSLTSHEKGRGLLAASRRYTPEEFSLIQKMKGGTPHERVIAELKAMMKTDFDTALQNFIGAQNTVVVQRQIEAITYQIEGTYNEVFRRLGFGEPVQLKAIVDP